jgi:hypothetical protein
MLWASAKANPSFLLRTRYWRNLLRALLSTRAVDAGAVGR